MVLRNAYHPGQAIALTREEEKQMESPSRRGRPAARVDPIGRVGQVLVFAVALFMCLTALAVAVSGPTLAQSSYPDVVSYRVTNTPNYTDPGHEAFWGAIPSTDVPLTASIAPGGGHTPDVQIKSANDGYNLYTLFRWNDTAGPSYASIDELWQAPNGTLMPLTSEDTANVTHLYYNATYYYQDRAALLWFLPQSLGRQQVPAMVLGSDGALTGGAAEIWHWQSNPTDNSPLDSGFPGGYTNATGTPIYPADNLSFAEDDYTNMTGFFTIPGNFGVGAPNLVPEADPFLIHVGSRYDNGSKTWTVEMVRSFTTPLTAPYCVQVEAGATYYVAFAIWNGRLGESSAYKSVSQWYTLTVSNETVSAPAGPAGGVPLAIAAATGVGLLLVGIMIGAVVRSFRKEEEK
jgi:hypothetical protein